MPERVVFDRALQLAGSHIFAQLPFVLISVLPPTVSPGAEAWTVFVEQDQGDHEAWHLRNGRDEAGAYEAQLIFLQLKQASDFSR